MDIVNDLRSEKDNVTDYVINLEELRNNDSQPFLDRLQDTMDEFQDLLDFVSTKSCSIMYVYVWVYECRYICAHMHVCIFHILYLF